MNALATVTPRGWKITELGRHVEFLRSATLSRAQTGATGDLAYLHYGDIHRSNATSWTGTHGARIGFRQRGTAELLRRGDIVFTDASEDREGVGRAVEIGDLSHAGGVAGLHTIALRPDPEVLAVGFGQYLQFMPSLRQHLQALAAGTKVLATNKTHLATAPLLLPSPVEQQAIAVALTDAGELVRHLGRLIAKKQAIKQGMMQQLLTGKTRLPGFGGEWIDTTLGELGRVLGGGTPSTRVQGYWGGEVPWFTPAEIAQEGSGLVSRSERMITKVGLESSGANLLPAGSVLITSRASIGNCAVAATAVSTNQGFASVIPSEPESTWFLYYWIQQHRDDLVSRAAGSTFLEISTKKVARIPIRIPGAAERGQVGLVIRDVDNDISALTRRLARARWVKQGMMQELLTGRTRLPVEGSAA